ncbi:MAG: helix-turn-helix transcriptional regulator [Thiomargarita sp.]|nr:helix-turn-helix transcriptional regulator [Thiomargarita sp.]
MIPKIQVVKSKKEGRKSYKRVVSNPKRKAAYLKILAAKKNEKPLNNNFAFTYYTPMSKEQFQDIRVEIGLTQAELGAVMNMSRHVIMRYERGTKFISRSAHLKILIIKLLSEINEHIRSEIRLSEYDIPVEYVPRLRTVHLFKTQLEDILGQC